MSILYDDENENNLANKSTIIVSEDTDININGTLNNKEIFEQEKAIEQELEKNQATSFLDEQEKVETISDSEDSNATNIQTESDETNAISNAANGESNSTEVNENTAVINSEDNLGEAQINENVDEESLLIKEHKAEAVLFMMGDAVEISTIALALECDKKEAEKACERLKEKYAKNHNGISLIRLDNKYQMVSSDEYFDSLVIVAANPKKPVLTDAVIETLAIIAYKQPITKTEIEKIRGVSSEHTVGRLLEYKLIEEAGRLDAPGKPILFKTTEDFLRRFGVSNTNELPTLSIERQVEIENEVREEMKSSFGETITDEEMQEASNEIDNGSKDDTEEKQNPSTNEEQLEDTNNSDESTNDTDEDINSSDKDTNNDNEAESTNNETTNSNSEMQGSENESQNTDNETQATNIETKDIETETNDGNDIEANKNPEGSNAFLGTKDKPINVDI